MHEQEDSEVAAGLRLFENLREALFLRRPNRFIVECLIEGEKTRVYLPNPGRLQELLFPGVTLYLANNSSSREMKTRYTVVAVEKDGVPVMLHTHHTNAVARWLIEGSKIPGLEGYRVARAEVPFGRSRFDFLLRKGKKEFILEVKSCTLFGRTIAMFPDAVTERGQRHIRELAELSRGRRKCGVLFVVHWPGARYFMPEHHTDLVFSQALLEVRNEIMIKAVAVGWAADLLLSDKVRELTIPWDVIAREARDRGSYILILHMPRSRKIAVGGLGERMFQKGYYLYAGSAMQNLTQRIERHKRLRKNRFWHIDYLREEASFVTVLPVRSGERLECALAGALGSISDRSVPGFGSSDCACDGHLFSMAENPLTRPDFIRLIQYFRIGRLEEALRGGAQGGNVIWKT